MKHVLLLLFVTLHTISGFGQKPCNKTLHDTIFQAGDLLSLPELMFGLARCDLRPESIDSIKLIANFLKAHPKFTVEFETHTDYQSPNSSHPLTQCRANTCRDTLVKMGIDPTRIACKGFGAKRPYMTNRELTLPSGKIIPKGTVLNEVYWKKFEKDKNDYSFLRALNRRSELLILSTGEGK
jgi:outer membrane protein OmpA-like peptidoglycan-associated protein